MTAKPIFPTWKRFRSSIILAGFVTCLLATGSSAQFFSTSTQRDIEQGAEVAKLVERQIGLCSLPVTEAYVRQVGERLTLVANDRRWKFSFQIVDQKEPNAFSIPGGGVYVSRGLLALLETEDELAGVLAHEIVHVTRRHSAREQRKGFLTGLFTVPGKLVGVVNENWGTLINAPIETAGEAWLSHYSRTQETEADRLGIQIAAQAGYQPTALADILQRLARDVASQSGKERPFSIFDSHPMTETRLRDILHRASSLTAAARPPIAGDTAALFATLDGIWWGENPEAGVFHKDEFLQPTIGFGFTLPTGWKHRNTPQYVISRERDGEAMLMLGLVDISGAPESTGLRFIESVRERTRIKPISAETTTVGNLPAFVATYLNDSGRQRVYLQFLWVKMAERTYQLIGFATEQHLETMRKTAATLRLLSEDERAAVTGKRLRIVAPRPGERLADLAVRSGNVWSEDYTALANGLSAEAILAEGTLVKIARLETVPR